jgi:hypothetical protein
MTGQVWFSIEPLSKDEVPLVSVRRPQLVQDWETPTCADEVLRQSLILVPRGTTL